MECSLIALSKGSLIMPNFINHLRDEASSYLLQHARNPVDWYPWNELSLSLARKEDKPILLSIGYSACHWCHVMAHESFEDEDTAKVMNTNFINIKVDKEERPDLDKIYQMTHQLINQRAGGWPLTVVLDPHTLLPFFVGTYFPKEARYGMPPFTEVLQQLAQFYREEKQELQSHQKQMQDVLQLISSIKIDPSSTLTEKPLVNAVQQLIELFDPENGGFGNQPKFPQPSNLERLLRQSYYDETKQNECLSMLFTTLDKMALGGIYDHLGGGFFRYSVDAKWHIPHFEKMLYDNGQLLSIYSDALIVTDNPLYYHHITQTADWVIKEMQAPNGGYYATVDADSEGEEGKFYIWNKQEITNLLDEKEYEIASHTFGLNHAANFENHWHLIVDDITHYPPAEDSLLQKICLTLHEYREQRKKPNKDGKIITSWNGLMIKGMAKAGLSTRNNEYIESAQKAVNFIQKNLWQSGRLFANYQHNSARFSGYLDDYAYLLDGILNLLEAKWSSQHLQFAIDLADAMIKYFWDDSNGGFYFTAHDHETLIYRPKPFTDEALPSGNGVAACALLKLGYLISELRYIEIAGKTLLTVQTSIDRHPVSHNTLLNALEDYLQPPTLIILRGEIDQLPLWQELCRYYFQPSQSVYAIPNAVETLPFGLQDKIAMSKTVAYICQGTACVPAISDLSQLKQYIER